MYGENLSHRNFVCRWFNGKKMIYDIKFTRNFHVKWKNNLFPEAFNFPLNELIDWKAQSLWTVWWIARAVKVCNERLIDLLPQPAYVAVVNISLMLIKRRLSNEIAELCVMPIGWTSINPHLNTVRRAWMSGMSGKIQKRENYVYVDGKALWTP